MLTINPAEAETKKVYGFLTASVCPRPIAFASTIDKDGNSNLAPFSFFNTFSADPPIVVFAPVHRIRNNTPKNTYENVTEVDEVVINVVSYDIMHQMVLTSTEYPKGVNEFEKAGFTPVPSEKVKPFRAKESPVQIECKIKEVKRLGDRGGAGNLVIAEVVYMHINESVLDENGKIDPYKLDPVARMGGIWYTRAAPGLVEIENPKGNNNIGMDGLPESIRNSSILTGNELAQMAKLQEMPAKAEIEALENDSITGQLLKNKENGKYEEEGLHSLARNLIQNRETEKALKVLLLNIKEQLPQ